jgi:flagellar L-ring protein precursor FlgH
MRRKLALISIFAFAPAGWAVAQSSSLFHAHVRQQQVIQSQTTQPAANGTIRTNAGTVNGTQTPQGQQPQVQNLALASVSLISTPMPEPKVIRVNDLLGVIVRHRYRSQIDARMQQDSEWDVESRLDAWFRIHDKRWQQQDFGGGRPEIGLSHQNEMENRGRTDRRDVLETRMQGKVIDVKPNGNLIIVAYYSISSDHDTQSLVLTGEVNQRDITADNTVTSDKVFALKIGSAPTGAVKDATKRGWLKELIDTVKPF